MPRTFPDVKSFNEEQQQLLGETFGVSERVELSTHFSDNAMAISGNKMHSRLPTELFSLPSHFASESEFDLVNS